MTAQRDGLSHYRWIIHLVLLGCITTELEPKRAGVFILPIRKEKKTEKEKREGEEKEKKKRNLEIGIETSGEMLVVTQCHSKLV